MLRLDENAKASCTRADAVEDVVADERGVGEGAW